MKKPFSLLLLPVMAMTLTSCGVSSEAFMKVWQKNHEAEMPAYTKVEITEKTEGLVPSEETYTVTFSILVPIATYALSELEAAAYQPVSEKMEEDGMTGKVTITLYASGTTLRVVSKSSGKGDGQSANYKSEIVWGANNLIQKEYDEVKVNAAGVSMTMKSTVTYKYII